MTLQVADRVMETTTTSGTGAITLAGAVAGFQAFSAVCSVGDTCYYAIEAVDANGVPTGDWETGLGTYSGASTLTRTTVQKSSNANAAVSFAVGTTKRVMISIDAAYLATLSSGGGGTVGGVNWIPHVPLASSFSLVSGDATQLVLTDDSDIGIHVDCGAPVTGTIMRFAYKTLTNKALAWDYKLGVQGMVARGSSSSIGLTLQDSISGQLGSLSFLREDTNQGWFRKSSLTSSDSAIAYAAWPNAPLSAIRARSDGTTLTISLSVDGKYWFDIYSETITASFPNKPDRVGFSSTTNHGPAVSTGGFPNQLAINFFTLTGAGV